MIKVFRTNNKKINIPIRGIAQGYIEKISRSEKGIRINGIWYYWGERTSCRKIKRLDRTWVSQGGNRQFPYLKVGAYVRLSYMNYDFGDGRKNNLHSIGVVEQ